MFSSVFVCVCLGVCLSAFVSRPDFGGNSGGGGKQIRGGTAV